METELGGPSEGTAVQGRKPVNVLPTDISLALQFQFNLFFGHKQNAEELHKPEGFGCVEIRKEVF